MKILTQITFTLSFLFLICGHTLYNSSDELTAETTLNACQEDDYIALRALYLSTDGDNWSDNTNWPDAAFFNTNPTLPADIDISSWSEITLDTSGCVKWVELSNNNLVGTIPPEIGNLNYVNRLYLSANQLSGTIPPEIGNLGNVYWLLLGGTQLSGAIPPEIGNLSTLTFLYLDNNQFTGTIPPEFGNLINLSRLYLNDNQLEGCYPLGMAGICEQLSYSNISGGNNFDVLWDDFCDFGSGTCPLTCAETTYLALRNLYLNTDGDNWTNNTNWPNAAFFNVNFALPTGTDMDTWYGVTTDANGCLTQLNLAANNLTGVLPQEMGDLSQLTELELYDNPLGSCYNTNLSNLCSQLSPAYNTNAAISDGTNLEANWEDFCNSGSADCFECLESDYLAIRALYLSADGDNWWSWDFENWPDAAFFNANPTRPSGLDMSDWTGIVLNEYGCITGIYLSNKDLDGDIPPEIGNLIKLESLWLSDNDLTSLPPEIGNLDSLRSLRITGSSLSGSIPPEIGNLSKLTHLNLYGNELSGSIPPEIGNLVNLEFLQLFSNQLTGSLPPEIGNLSNLVNLHLSSNPISGNIPPEIGNLSNLARLAFGYNTMTGSIPPEIGNLVSLEDLSIGFTQLTGSIPPEIGNLNNLTNLYLGNNQLSGNIPPEIGDMSSLIYFDISNNQLTGNIPPEIGNLSSSLVNITLNDNQLSGSIPPEIGNLNNLTFLNLSNNQLTGKLIPEIGNLSFNYLNVSNNQLSGCYHPDLVSICDLYGYCSNGNASISDGNNFDTPWGDFCCSFGETGGCVACLEDAYVALRALYLDTDGTNWATSTNWPDTAFFNANPTLPVGTSMNNWYGITTNSDDCIIEINLNNNNLNGAIPNEISGILNLMVLDLSQNQLSGNIHYDLYDLTNLTVLNLANNQLNGTIPAYNFSNLSNLTELRLANNQFTGEIPPDIINLNNLSILTLNDNALSNCYHPDLAALCSQLSPIYSTNAYISDGNGFDADWEDFCSGNSGNCDACKEASYNALRALYLATDGDSWSSTIVNWPDAAFFNTNPTPPPGLDMSNWAGVTVNSGGCVTELDFYSSSLDGNIPPEIQDLYNLKHLNLNRNRISGTIPSEIGNLPNLEILNLGRNELTGAIPPEIGNLNNLTDLILSANVLTGIPAEIGNLDNLVNFYINANDLAGNIPPEIGNLDNLVYLELSSNMLIGTIPPEIGNLNSLKTLYLNYNYLSGALPTEIGNLSSLETLYLHDNNISGMLPSGIGNLNNIITINLFGNNLSGTLPPEIGNLSTLEVLYLGNNQLTGVPPEIGNLSNLEQLSLNSNQLSDIPLEISNLNNLEYLSLNYNQFTNFPPQIGNLSSLTSFDIYHNQASGCFHENLLNLCDQIQYGQSVDLGNNFDASWSSFCSYESGICPNTCMGESYTALRALYLSTDGDNWTNNTGWPDAVYFNTYIALPAGTSVNNWYGVTLDGDGCITAIDLSSNNLNGTIPGELGDLTALTALDLSDNQLSGCYDFNLFSLCGQLPSNYNSNISDGNNLDADWEDFCNDLAGFCSLPSCQQADYLALRALYLSTDGDNWTDNTNWPDAAFFSTNPLMPPGTNVNDWYGISTYDDCVFIINMTSNNMIGLIPPEIEYLTNPKNISFTWNSFNGSIPPEIGNLTSLTGLGFWGNDLSGSIPPEIGNLVNLESLHLSGNDLTGNIPASIGNLTELKELRLRGNMLSGSIPPEIGNLNQLEWQLDLSSNQLSGNIPPQLGYLYNLEVLYLDDNQLTGSLPPEFQYLYSLERLELQNNLLTGTIPGELGNMPSLTRIFLENNNMSGCFDSNLSNWCFGQFAQINIDSGNNFDVYWSDFCYEGVGMCPLPCDEADYIALRELYLSTNGDNWTNNTNWPNSTFFNDNPTLPVNVNVATWYGISTNANGCVNALNLSGNSLNGMIPVDLKDMTSLTQLELYNNQLYGCYPFDLLYLCTQLESVYSTNTAISNGNNLDTAWESFCNSDGAACNPCQRDDYIALRSLYLNTDGDNWHNRNYWPDAAFFQANPTLPFGMVNMATWHGISVNDEGCVSGINLCCNNLTGSIPPEIGNIENLSYMEIIENHGLTGTIPGEFGNLSNLAVLYIDYSSLSGCYDANLQNLCGQIPDFDFNINAGNYFDALWSSFCSTGAGTCITNTCQATDDYLALRALYLSTDGDNWYDNTNWPSAAFFAANPTLPSGTDMNSWYGISADASSGCVKRIYLPYNNLVGNIPLEIGNLLNLRELYLQNNQLTGNIPAETGNLSGLNILYLANNQLNGEIPAEIGNLGNLRETYLRNNQLTGCFDANLQNLCGQMTSYYYGADNAISDGNNFEATWTAFCQSGVSACCPPLLTVDGVIPTNIYQSGDEIISSGTVPTSGNVQFKAEQLIKLDTNFTIEPNADFSAEIEDCGN